MEGEREMAKEQMRRILTEAFAQGRLDVLDELLTADFVNHNAPPGISPGIAGVKQIVALERSGFPDLEYVILREVEQGDLVVQHATVHGTHLGTIFGVEPTGRRVQWNEMHIARVRDGRCAEHWGVTDMAALWVQLGRATPVPPSAVS
jgi:predicted ester cyclase